jgi:hypothetical protein
VITELISLPFATAPRETLYHYTSFSGVLGIVGTRMLRASDIRYMNDSAEMRHTADLVRHEIGRRLAAGDDHPRLLNQFQDWISQRVISGHMLFGASFRANGNLLSQWRGYSVHGKGVSLGFAPEHIIGCAAAQGFQVGQCLYDPAQQRELITRLIDAIETIAAQQDEAGERRPGDPYQAVFEAVEADILRLAALLKHPSFEEEQEWRIVSPVVTEICEAPIRFREGASMLVPYYEFQLWTDTRPMQLEHVWLGPTSHSNQSMTSLDMYLRQQGVFPSRGISYCQIPYRQK